MDVNLQERLQAFNTEGVQLLPDGAYTLEVVKVTEGGGGKGPYLNVIFKVIGGPEAGKQTKANLSFSEAASNIFFQQIYSMGLTEDDVKRCAGLTDLGQLLVGRILEHGAVTNSEFNGRVKQEFGIGQFKLVSVASQGAPAGVPPAAAPATPPAAPPAQPPAAAAAPPAPPAAAPAAPPVPPVAPAAAAPVPPTAPDGTPAPAF